MEDMRTCPLCGYRFDAAAMACHTSCPLSTGCHILCCPNCGYQAPDENQMRVAGMFKRLWEARKQKQVEQEIER